MLRGIRSATDVVHNVFDVSPTITIIKRNPREQRRDKNGIFFEVIRITSNTAHIFVVVILKIRNKKDEKRKIIINRRRELERANQNA